MDLVSALALATIPLTIVILMVTVKHLHRVFYLLFVSHFLVLLAGSVVDIRVGIVTIVLNVIIVLVIIVSGFSKRVSWKESNNGMLWIFLIWAIYCIAELANPNTVLEAWGITAVIHFVYPIICAIFVPLTIRKFRNVEWLLIVWSVFIILAAFKGYWQQSHGFNARELRFLFEEGGAQTHIIWSGIRYFSFFTDAANYGVHMAMGVLGFSISAYYVKSKWLKIYFVIIVLLALYGMFISGTRTAMIIPLGGLIAFTLISRNFKTLLLGAASLALVVFFFMGTNIGGSNSYIRKMRSAFTPQTDASFQVRIQNRELIKEYMNDKPFGYGLGLGGGRGTRYNLEEAMPIPPDSWLVNVWMDTGTAGLVLYILIHVILFAWCSWILAFKLTNRRLRDVLSVWLCINAGFFIATYTNDIMQYPNIIIVYTGFALCFAGPSIEANEKKSEAEILVS